MDPEQPDLFKPAKALGGKDLTPKDLKDFSVARQKIVDLMSDGAWHTKEEMRQVTGQDCALRRAQDLRDFGYELEAKRVTGQRFWLYRLSKKD